MLLHFLGELLQRDVSISIIIHLLKEELDLLFDDGRVNDPNKLAELFEIELMIGFVAHIVEQFVEVDVFGVDLESQLRHHHFELIFELLVLFCVLFEVAFENRMQEDFIPTQSFLLSQMQTSSDKIFSLWFEIIVDL